MANEKKPIQLGFSSGQSIALKLEPAEMDKLIAAIKAGEAWHTVTDDDRKLTLRADRVDFYGVDEKPESRRAGF
ncbi:MAG: hypothetical protein HZB14_09455 [Actinobacteria bacterium]|nr:hypothetical protein [Actinomycetota bacterium]